VAEGQDQQPTTQPVTTGAQATPAAPAEPSDTMRVVLGTGGVPVSSLPLMRAEDFRLPEGTPRIILPEPTYRITDQGERDSQFRFPVTAPEASDDPSGGVTFRRGRAQVPLGDTGVQFETNGRRFGLTYGTKF